MAIYSIVVIETVTVRYPAVEIDADSEEEAQEIAEGLRCDGYLGEPHAHETVDNVDYEIRLDPPKSHV